MRLDCSSARMARYGDQTTVLQVTAELTGKS